MRVLLIEDDGLAVRSIELMLSGHDFEVQSTEFGEDGISLCKLGKFDVAVLDLQLPDMSGIDVLRTLRAGHVDTPILVLSGNASAEVKVQALKLGADDYLTKPFHKDEFIARLRAVVRRSRASARSVITIGKIALDLDMKTVAVDGAPVHLTTKEYEMLKLLSVRKGMTLSKEMILNQLYGGMDEPNEKIIDVFVCKLRKKLALGAGDQDYIKTIWGRGYELRDPAVAPLLAA